MAQIKAVALKETHIQYTHRFKDIVNEVSRNIDVEDIIITYNSSLYNEFSFSIDNTLNDKYDFVTLALRDIAKGLGLGINITANNQKLIFPNTKKPFYESSIWKSLEDETESSAYIKCTQGSLDIVNLPSLYAPNPWVNGVSLQYYIPDEEDPLSKLLTYDFGKGYVMRDLSGYDWENKFKYLLDWDAMITVGASTGSKSESGSTKQSIPYQGIIDFSNSFGLNTANLNQSSQTDFANTLSSLDNESTTSFYDLCIPYNYFYTGEKKVYFGYSISALLKDGKWDVLYAEYSPSSLTFKIDDLNLNYPDSMYARSCSGGLRYRLTKCERDGDPKRYPSNYYVKYFTRDYLPQKANIKYSKIHMGSEYSNLNSIRASDDYFVDVEIGISNIEGTTKVIVEQLDEGERIPFRYEAENFRQGFFIANLDRELSSQLTVISYNDNGQTKSETIVIPAVGYDATPQNISFELSPDNISINGLENSNNKASFTIINMIDSNIIMNGSLDDNKTIDITDLKPGIYAISVENGNQIKHYKFSK